MAGVLENDKLAFQLIRRKLPFLEPYREHIKENLQIFLTCRKQHGVVGVLQRWDRPVARVADSDPWYANPSSEFLLVVLNFSVEIVDESRKSVGRIDFALLRS